MGLDTGTRSGLVPDRAPRRWQMAKDLARPEGRRDTARAMSQENVEIIRDAHARWARGDFSSQEFLDPDIEVFWQTPDATVTRGVEALAEGWREWLSPWENLTVEAERLIEAGNRVVVLAVLRGRGKGSGIEIELRAGYVWTLRDRKAIRLEAYGDHKAALEAAGLSE
jgi:ketosteroid isomerase-like protein